MTSLRGGPLAEGSGTGGVDLDRTIARLLTVGTYLSVGLLAIGVVLMARAGISPISGTAPALDVSEIPSSIRSLQPEGFLWLGLITAILTPLARVAASLVGFARARERRMVAISVAILAVVAVGVVVGISAGRAPGG